MSLLMSRMFSRPGRDKPASGRCPTAGNGENMIFVWIVIGVLGLLLSLFIMLWLNAIRASGVRNRQLDKMVQPAVDAAGKNLPAARELVAELAKHPGVRNHLFRKLKEIGSADIFPEHYRAIEKIAESDLARWLMHPNELRAVPDEMELVRAISVREEEKSGSVFLFRFRMNAPHWAAENGWMAGVAGPYWEGDDAPDFAVGTFSEFTPFDKMTEEQHVDFLREKLKSRGLVVPY